MASLSEMVNSVKTRPGGAGQGSVIRIMGEYYTKVTAAFLSNVVCDRGCRARK